MNKLLFDEGGQPLHLDDLAFMQKALSEPFETLLASWGNCILGGCRISIDRESGETRVSSGYIAFGGAVYEVSAVNLGQTEQADTFYWLFYTSREGQKTFENGNEEATRLRHYARLTSTREAPTSAPSIADSLLPRLGVDIAPRPHQSYKYEGQGQLVEFRELSRYSGVLTLLLSGEESLPRQGYFATFSLTGINNMQGQWVDPTSERGRTIRLSNGKLYISEQDAPNSGTTSHLSFPRHTYITLFISWDYEESNGAGNGLNPGIGSNYTGRGRTIYTYPDAGRSPYDGSRPRR